MRHDLPADRHDDTTYALRSVEADGTTRETQLDAGQALDLGSGRPVAYFPHDERLHIDEQGQLLRSDSAVPRAA